jgi:hypothetical protein
MDLRFILYFYGSVSNWFIAPNGLVIDEVEMKWKEAVMFRSRYYPSSCLEELRNTTKRTDPHHQSTALLLSEPAQHIDGGERTASRSYPFNRNGESSF